MTDVLNIRDLTGNRLASGFFEFPAQTFPFTPGGQGFVEPVDKVPGRFQGPAGGIGHGVEDGPEAAADRARAAAESQCEQDESQHDEANQDGAAAADLFSVHGWFGGRLGFGGRVGHPGAVCPGQATLSPRREGR